MSDVLLVATVLAFFLGAALLVRASDRITAAATEDADSEREAGSEQEAERPA
jgi:hypothetical protein